MPNSNRNKKGANKNRGITNHKREIIYKEEGQVYAFVSKMLGNCRVECDCLDGIKRQAKIRGAMIKRKQFVNLSDLVLLSLRDFQNEVADVIHVYSREEVNQLRRERHIDDKQLASYTEETDTEGCIDDVFDFENI